MLTGRVLLKEARETLPLRSVDITGIRVGCLTAEKYLGTDGRRAVWLIRCECGNTKQMISQSFKNGDAFSCGCRTSEWKRRNGLVIGAKMATHRMSKHPAYAVWRSLTDRCRLPTNKAWDNYGARGITVCTRWQESFQNFWEDMGDTYEKGLSLDRIDNNQGYSKENCRWTTRRVQARNTRRNRTIDTPKGPMLVVEAAEVSGINVTTLLYRVNNGVHVSRLFDPPDFTNRFTIY